VEGRSVVDTNGMGQQQHPRVVQVPIHAMEQYHKQAQELSQGIDKLVITHPPIYNESMKYSNLIGN
jgi:hypothetical protein